VNYSLVGWGPDHWILIALKLLALPGLEGLQIILTIPSLINPISYFI
jgi:hypothetical protein